MTNPYEPPSSEAAQPRPHIAKRIARQIAGWSLLVLGIAGLVLPILQGWLFIAIAAFLLAPDVPFFGRVLDRIELKIPVLRPTIARLRGERHKKHPR